MWPKDHLSKATLATVIKVLCIDEHSVLAESLFAGDSEYPISPGPETIREKLSARVISFETRFEITFPFKQQSRIAVEELAQRVGKR